MGGFQWSLVLLYMHYIYLSLSEDQPVLCGIIYRPPDMNDQEYLSQLNTFLSRKPVCAHTCIGGDFNLGHIYWEAEVNKSRLCQQLLTISRDNFLDQMVTEPTRITEDTENILNLFFCKNSPLVNRVEVTRGSHPGISDHESTPIKNSVTIQEGPPIPQGLF